MKRRKWELLLSTIPFCNLKGTSPSLEENVSTLVNTRHSSWVSISKLLFDGFSSRRILSNSFCSNLIYVVNYIFALIPVNCLKSVLISAILLCPAIISRYLSSIKLSPFCFNYISNNKITGSSFPIPEFFKRWFSKGFS